MAAADWGLIGTWAGVAVGVVGVAWGVLHARGADARTKAADARADEAALSVQAWALHGLLHPVAGIGIARSKSPSIEVWVDGANVWVHEVRFSWSLGTPFEVRTFTAEDVPCSPWDRQQLPLQLFAKSGETLRLAWPGAMPAEQRSLTHKLRARYSLTRDGPTFWRDVAVEHVMWQDP